MADFDVVVASGAILEKWVDPPAHVVIGPSHIPPATQLMPSRINPSPHAAPLFNRVTVNQPVILHCIVNGVVTPLDTALGGRLFTATWLETPIMCAIVGTPGQSSIQTFTPPAAGHYTLQIRRDDGGAHILHFDAVAPP